MAAKKLTEKDYDDIPGTYVFDADRSRQGYHLNMFCMSLMKAENRKAFKADEAKYLDQFPLTPEQREAILKRQYNRMLELGGNIYFTAKLGATDGHPFQHLAAVMTGSTQQDYADLMLRGGRNVEGNRSRSGKYAKAGSSIVKESKSKASKGKKRRGYAIAEPSIAERMTVNADAKQRIAHRALDVITDGYRGAVVFDAGSTVGAVAAALGDRVAVTGAQLDVVTHAVPVAHTLSLLTDVGLTILGGQVRGLTAAAVGHRDADRARLAAPRPRVRRHERRLGGLRPQHPRSCRGRRQGRHRPCRPAHRPRRRSGEVRRRVVRAVRTASTDIDILVTDAAPDAELAAALAAADVEVWTA